MLNVLTQTGSLAASRLTRGDTHWERTAQGTSDTESLQSMATTPKSRLTLQTSSLPSCDPLAGQERWVLPGASTEAPLSLPTKPNWVTVEINHPPSPRTLP